ncbi:uncharacterized protein LOC109807197 [Cajanus cajan]|uniref:uncharacterized protein LOC109807197 n=1 Tax=Cajanus cajan TaxID=3821 RepID=UPI00098D7DEF|nr:uncharacterized protein LOC109807197 [Cajanus cajan]
MGLENEWHLFFDCAEAQAIWNASGIWTLISHAVNNGNDFKETLGHLLNSLSHENIVKMVVSLWCIWQRHNNKIWSNTTTPPHLVISQSMQKFEEWQHARAKEHPPPTQSSSPGSWTRPQVGFIKGNVDATIFKEDNKVGFGICLRDATGSLIKAKSGWLYGVAPPHEEEATTLLESIRWVCDQGYTRVILESDSKQVVEDILNSNIYYSEYGHTLHRCHSLLNSHPNLLVRFIRRQANHVAHSLTRTSRYYASSHVFYFIPTCIAPLILNDIS